MANINYSGEVLILSWNGFANRIRAKCLFYRWCYDIKSKKKRGCINFDTPSILFL